MALISNAETETEGSRQQDLLALSVDDRKRLAAYASICAQGTGEAGEDLLQGAYLRWLASETVSADTTETVRFLMGAIKSQRFNLLRKMRTVKATFGERATSDPETGEDPVEQAPSSGTSPESYTLAQQLYDLLSDDPDVQMLLMCKAQQMSKTEIMTDLSWDSTKYEAVKQRKRRTVIKFMREGKV